MKVTSLELSPEAMMKMGEFVIRVCILSFRTHQPEVEEALEVIKTAARKLETA